MTRKQQKQLKKLSQKAKHVAIQGAKQAHVGKQAKELISQALKAGIAAGSGAYGRGEYAYGRGDYGLVPQEQPSVNSLFKEYTARRHNTNKVRDETGRVSISRREYVMAVKSPAIPAAFTNTSLSINPGLSGVFSWLSQLASNYDEYSMRHLVFHYKPVISRASQSGSMGSVVFACNYNAGAQKFNTFKEMVEYESALEARICDEALFGVECDDSKSGNMEIEYVRTGTVPAGQDIKTYDIGLLQVATSDISATDYPAGTLIGHLYVEYEVILGKPKLFTALGKGILQDSYTNSTGFATAKPFGTVANVIARVGNSLGAVLVESGNIVLPDNFVGRLQITYNVDSSSATDSMAAPTIAGNVTTVPLLNGTWYQTTETNASSHNFLTAIIDVKERSPGGTANSITVACSNLANGISMSVTISQLNPLVN
jgi:hypothetical protein